MNKSSQLFSGQYRLWLPQKIGLPFSETPDVIVKNIIPDAAWDEFFKMIFQDVSAIAGGANFFAGLCEQAPIDTDTLPSIITEPTSAGSYARQSIQRSAAGWPLLTTINGKQAIRSSVVIFAAVGADFSRTFNRFFLTDQATGTAGILYSYSGALTSPVLITDGNNIQFEYEVLANQ